MNMPTLN